MLNSKLKFLVFSRQEKVFDSKQHTNHSNIMYVTGLWRGQAAVVLIRFITTLPPSSGGKETLQLCTNACRNTWKLSTGVQPAFNIVFGQIESHYN